MAGQTWKMSVGLIHMLRPDPSSVKEIVFVQVDRRFFSRDALDRCKVPNGVESLSKLEGNMLLGQGDINIDRLNQLFTISLERDDNALGSYAEWEVRTVFGAESVLLPLVEVWDCQPMLVVHLECDLDVGCVNLHIQRLQFWLV